MLGEITRRFFRNSNCPHRTLLAHLEDTSHSLPANEEVRTSGGGVGAPEGSVAPDSMKNTREDRIHFSEGENTMDALLKE
jgi:hypothetical protein